MPLFDRSDGWRLGLPPVRAARIRTRRDLAIPLPGGGRLLADRHHPADDERAPVVLMRTPYGRRANTSWMARLIARRGYQVLAVSLGGTGGSSGAFRGWVLDEREPGAIMDWLRARPWFCGALATWGASFLGYAQWQMGAEPVQEWRAALIQDAPPEVYDSVLYRGGAFALGDWLRWAQQTSATAATGRDPSVLRGLWALLPGLLRGRRATAHLPVTGADRVLAGKTIGFFQEWLAHPDPGDPLWAAMDHTGNAARLPPIVHLAGAWQDPFLPGVLAGEAALRSSDPRRRVRLLIGPWTHGWGLFTREYMSEAFAVLDHALRGEGRLPEAPVKVKVGGAGGTWRELDRWPPPRSETRRLYLHPGGGLGAEQPTGAAPTPLHYDPADPTPSVGGPVLFGGGAKDSRALAGRADTAAFSGPELTRAVQVAGPVRAEVHVRASRRHADVFVRLCDIGPAGEWTHVCDGIVRLGERGGARAAGQEFPLAKRPARVELWPAAHRFAPGHRIGVIVAAGAHPRYDRNLGTGGQRGSAVRANDIDILHDGEHPSALVLSVEPD